MEKIFGQSKYAIGCMCIPMMEFITENDTLEPMEVGGELNDNIEYFYDTSEAHIRIIELLETDMYTEDMLDVYVIDTNITATPYILT